MIPRSGAVLSSAASTGVWATVAALAGVVAALQISMQVGDRLTSCTAHHMQSHTFNALHLFNAYCIQVALSFGWATLPTLKGVLSLLGFPPPSSLGDAALLVVPLLVCMVAAVSRVQAARKQTGGKGQARGS